MAKLPTKANLSGAGSFRSGAPVASENLSGLARGAASFAGSIEQIGKEVRQNRSIQDGATADGLALKALNDFERSFDSDTEYDTFSDRFEKGAKDIVSRAAAHIRDPQAKLAWQADFQRNVLSSRNRVLDLGASRTREARLVNHRAALEGYQSVISDTEADEQARERAKRNASAAIDAAFQSGDLTPDEADKWRNNVLRGGEFVYGQRMIEQNPEIITGRLPASVSGRANAAMSFFEGKGYSKVQAAGIVGNLLAESNLQASGAVGDAGTAFGIAQWREARLDNLKRFAASKGKSWQDFETQLEFVDFELRNSEKGAYGNLMRAETVDEATAAFIGYERPEGWTSANPRGGMHYDKRLTYAAQASGEEVKPDWFLRQTPEDQFRLESAASARQTEIANALAKEQTAARGQVKDALQLRINTVDPTLTRDDILSNPTLDDGDKATLVSSYDTKMKDVRNTALALQAFGAGRLAIDPYSTDGRKIVDNLFSEFATSAAPEDMTGITGEIVRQTGIVPDTVQNSIRKGLGSQDVAEVSAAAQTASRLYAIDPEAFGRRDGGGDVSKSVILFDHYVGDLGFSPEEAAQKIIDQNNPETRRARQALLETKEIKDHLKKVDDGDVASIFDPGLFSFAPDVGETDAARAAIVADYKDVLTESIVDAGGDMDLAEKLAADRFSRIYGTSELALSGPSVVTKYPPEVVYPPDRSGSHEYIKTQAVESLRGEGVEFDGDLFLQPVPPSATDTGTAGDIKAGRPPRYMVYYEKDGVLQQYTLPFYAIPNIEVDLTENANQMIRNRAIEEERRKFLESGDLSWKGVSDMLDAVRMRPEMNGRLGAGGQSGGGF